MSLADFTTPLSPIIDPIESIPDSSKSKSWQDVENGIIHGEHIEDSQQRHFHSSQPKAIKPDHRYPTRSRKKRSVSAVDVDDTEPTKFVYLRDKGETTIPVWKQLLENKPLTCDLISSRIEQAMPATV